MRDINKARRLFDQAKLAFPAIPIELAAQMMQRGKWLFSTRDLTTSPYDLNYYIDEAEGLHLNDYAVLSHAGHGVNSYAIQYYLVLGGLRMFLHLGWGGLYMDADSAASRIAECFSLADRIVAATPMRLAADDRLLVVASDFYGSYWSPPGKDHRKETTEPAVPTGLPFQKISEGYENAGISLPAMIVPEQVLRDVVLWLEDASRAIDFRGRSTAVEP